MAVNVLWPVVPAAIAVVGFSTLLGIELPMTDARNSISQLRTNTY